MVDLRSQRVGDGDCGIGDSLLGAAQFTTMPVWLPVIVGVSVSVAVTDWVPAVLRIKFPEKTWEPASVALKV